MKTSQRLKCGSLVAPSQLAPAQETLNQHGEIFSCGGVYLGLNRESPMPTPSKTKAASAAFWHLPNYQKEVLVLQKGEVRRSSHEPQAPQVFNPQESLQTEEAIRRLFKESLN